MTALVRQWRTYGARMKECRTFGTAAGNKVRIHEVTPRDGLQNEKTHLQTEDKIELCKLLTEANPASIELTSFVRADRVPALKDAEELCRTIADKEWHEEAIEKGIRFAALVPNNRGMDTFLKVFELGCPDTVVVITSCTESHSKANVGRSIDDALMQTLDVIYRAKDAGVRVQAYCSMAFGCPFEGDVDPEVVLKIVDAYGEAGADVIGLADTLGVAKPGQVTTLVEGSKKVLGDNVVDKLSLHMHDTTGTAQATCFEGYQLGVRQFDAAVGGCGGCNFAPGAKGNLSTQSLLSMLDYAQADHGMDMKRLHETHEFLETCLKRELDKEAAIFSG
eukprot:CAMPEP_0167759748 /NCGR_PEP_ID=MMETSP0110_2-20121227/11195_1 /TAXON_ID=629695 /ORGANISM="Gymnochlora sp., Strain CCMP2014" /LENGTH=334 /DNA_ID=CAMNT_0007646167 /DNA_START=9 /DNA_END=1013 /DNA_ORIENTATION=+